METNPFRAARQAERRPAGASRPGPLGRLRRAVTAGAAEYAWRPRALLLPVMAWVLWNVATGRAWDGPLHEPFGGITLAVHEAGHAAFSWLGSPLLTAAGGTIFQLAIPLLVAWMFVRRGDWTGAAVGVFWFGTSLWGAGVYAADALDQVLPRVSPWGGADDVLSHDWTVMLLRVQRISQAEALGGAMQSAGTAVMAGALAFAAWVVWVLREAETGSAAPATPRP